MFLVARLEGQGHAEVSTTGIIPLLCICLGKPRVIKGVFTHLAAPHMQALRWGCVAGALTATRLDAVPSLPTRDELLLHLRGWPDTDRTDAGSVGGVDGGEEGGSSSVESVEGGDAGVAGLRDGAGGLDGSVRGVDGDGAGSSSSGSCAVAGNGACVPADSTLSTPHGCPLKFASRLNSMAARPDLWDARHGAQCGNGGGGSGGGSSSGSGSGASCRNLKSWLARQGTVPGLDLVDFNFPQHLPREGQEGPSMHEVC